jgi:hypothetical protein
MPGRLEEVPAFCFFLCFFGDLYLGISGSGRLGGTCLPVHRRDVMTATIPSLCSFCMFLETTG